FPHGHALARQDPARRGAPRRRGRPRGSLAVHRARQVRHARLGGGGGCDRASARLSRRAHTGWSVWVLASIGVQRRTPPTGGIVASPDHSKSIQIQLAERPSGWPTDDTFRTVTVDLPELAE